MRAGEAVMLQPGEHWIPLVTELRGRKAFVRALKRARRRKLRMARFGR